MVRQFGTLLVLALLVALSSCSSTPADGVSCPLQKTGQYSVPSYSLVFDASGSYAVICNSEVKGQRRRLLHVIDVANRAKPRLLAEKVVEQCPDDVVIDGARAYLLEFVPGPTGRVTSVSEIDLTRGGLPVVQNATLPIATSYGDMTLYDGHLYLVTEDGFHVLDKDALGTYQPSAFGTKKSARVYVDKDARRAYVSGHANLLDVYDVSNASTPVLLDPGSVKNPYEEKSASAITARGGVVALAFGKAGVVVLDARDLANVQLAGMFETGDLASDIALKGKHALVADRFQGVQIVDASDPSAPARVGDCDTDTPAVRLALVGDDLFVLDGAEGLLVYDASAIR